MTKTAFLPAMVNAYVPGSSNILPAREQAMIARRERLLGPAYRLMYERPLHIVRGEGAWLIDPDGDAISTSTTTSVPSGIATRR